MAYIVKCFVMIVWAAGITMTIIQWKQSPKKSLITFTACMVMLMGSVFELGGFALAGFSSSGFLVRILSLAETLCDLSGPILLVVALLYSEKKAVQNES